MVQGALPSHKIKEFLDDYVNSVSYYLKLIPEETLTKVSELLCHIRANSKRIFVAGNGGSSAISEHLSCDFSKGSHIEDITPLKIHSLSSNLPLISAIANDISYDDVFSEQLKYLNLTQDDLLILISSSGNSKNIIKAAEYAHSKRTKILGFTGFHGGKLQALSDLNLHIPIQNYGIVEDCHQTLMHILAKVHLNEVKTWI